MHLLLCGVILVLATATSAYVPESTSQTDLLAGQSLLKLTVAAANGNLKAYLAKEGVDQSCDLSKLSIRREYSLLSGDEKLEYTSAIKCLMAAPSQLPDGLAPGAKSRYDDFVATHVNQTRKIHFDGWFLPWHRAYIWSFERALRDECGYKGYLPYWNWGKSAQDPLNSPYMDGSETSQGGNGVWSPHNCTKPGGAQAIYCIPVTEGQGGGCVETGPYVGFMVNISATMPTLNATDAPVVGDFLGYDPRCIRRDISSDVSKQWSTDHESYDLLTNPLYQTGIGAFQDRLEGRNFSSGYLGLHGAGHYTFGGDPGGDVYNSPNDPLFWLHHANIDRTWWIWQNADPLVRSFQINGTRTMLNNPASDNATIEDIMTMDYITPQGAATLAIKHHVSSVAGPYCYVYL